MKARLLFLILLLIGSALIAGWFFNLQPLQNTPSQVLQIPDNIDYYLDQVDYRAMNGQGKLHYKMQAARLEHYIREDVSQIAQPRFQLNGDNARWQIQSETATLQHRQQRFELQQQVLLRRQSTASPMRLQTHLLILQPEQNQADIPQHLTLQSASLSLQAASAQLNMKTGQYRFNRVKATYSPQ